TTVCSAPGCRRSRVGAGTTREGSALLPAVTVSSGAASAAVLLFRSTTTSSASSGRPNHDRQRCGWRIELATTSSAGLGGSACCVCPAGRLGEVGVATMTAADTTDSGAVASAALAPLLLAQITHGQGTGGKRATTCDWNAPVWSVTTVWPATTSQSVLPCAAWLPQSCTLTADVGGKPWPVTLTSWPTVAAWSDTVIVGGSAAAAIDGVHSTPAASSGAKNSAPRPRPTPAPAPSSVPAAGGDASLAVRPARSPRAPRAVAPWPGPTRASAQRSRPRHARREQLSARWRGNGTP